MEKKCQYKKLSELEKERFVYDRDHKYEARNTQHGEYQNWKSAE